MIFQSLGDIINEFPDSFASAFSNFQCRRDEDIEKFLSEYAVDYEKQGVTRTFLILDDNPPAKIMGYYSIGVNVLHFDDIKKVEDAYVGIELYPDNNIPIYNFL